MHWITEVQELFVSPLYFQVINNILTCMPISQTNNHATLCWIPLARIDSSPFMADRDIEAPKMLDVQLGGLYIQSN